MLSIGYVNYLADFNYVRVIWTNDPLEDPDNENAKETVLGIIWLVDFWFYGVLFARI